MKLQQKLNIKGIIYCRTLLLAVSVKHQGEIITLAQMCPVSTLTKKYFTTEAPSSTLSALGSQGTQTETLEDGESANDIINHSLLPAAEPPHSAFSWASTSAWLMYSSCRALPPFIPYIIISLHPCNIHIGNYTQRHKSGVESAA